MSFTKKDTNYAVAEDGFSIMAGYPTTEYVKGERIVAIPTEKMLDGGLKVFLQEASEM